MAILGNFVNRAVVLDHKYFDGKVPAIEGELTDVDREVLAEVKAAVEATTADIENFKFREALRQAMNVARAGNKYLADTEPWKVWKTDPQRVATILNVSLQICATIAVVFEPFLPFMSGKLTHMLGLDKLSWDMAGRDDLLAAGHVIGKPEILFEKIDDEAITAQTDRLARIKEENKLAGWAPEAVKPACSFDDFEKVDIRVGKVLECEKVKKSKKLLKFKIDDGMGGRTILSGIAGSYPEPEKLVGMEVLFIANFAPRNMMGHESQGMILSAVNPDGSLTLCSPSADVAPGAQVG